MENRPADAVPQNQEAEEATNHGRKSGAEVREEAVVAGGGEQITSEQSDRADHDDNKD